MKKIIILGAILSISCFNVFAMEMEEMDRKEPEKEISTFDLKDEWVPREAKADKKRENLDSFRGLVLDFLDELNGIQEARDRFAGSDDESDF